MPRFCVPVVGLLLFSLSARAQEVPSESASALADPGPDAEGTVRLERDLGPRTFVGIVASADFDPSGSTPFSEFDYVIDLVPTLGVHRRFALRRVSLVPRIAIGAGFSSKLVDPEPPISTGSPYLVPNESGGTTFRGVAGTVLAGMTLEVTPSVGLLFESGLVIRRHTGRSLYGFEASSSPSAGATFPDVSSTSARWVNRLSLLLSL